MAGENDKFKHDIWQQTMFQSVNWLSKMGKPHAY